MLSRDRIQARDWQTPRKCLFICKYKGTEELYPRYNCMEPDDLAFRTAAEDICIKPGSQEPIRERLRLALPNSLGCKKKGKGGPGRLAGFYITGLHLRKV